MKKYGGNELNYLKQVLNNKSQMQVHGIRA